MPEGPRGEKRPTDLIGAAVLVGRIATRDIEEIKDEKNPHASALGKLGGMKGGKTRANKLSAKKRQPIPRKIAQKKLGKING